MERTSAASSSGSSRNHTFFLPSKRTPAMSAVRAAFITTGNGSSVRGGSQSEPRGVLRSITSVRGVATPCSVHSRANSALSESRSSTSASRIGST